jgi:hypothetical protein
LDLRIFKLMKEREKREEAEAEEKAKAKREGAVVVEREVVA